MDRLNTIYWIILIVSGYILGSVMFAREIPKLLGYGDITLKSDDGNPGAANAFKNCGVLCGSLCLFFDMLKGFAPVFLANLVFGISSVQFAAVMLMPVLGHAYPIFNHFRGGKCIATAFGVLIGCMPSSYIGFLLAGLYILFSVLIKINPHRIRSIITFMLFAFISFPILLLHRKGSVALGCVGISAIAIIKHTKHFAHVSAAVSEAENGETNGEDNEIRENHA